MLTSSCPVRVATAEGPRRPNGIGSPVRSLGTAAGPGKNPPENEEKQMSTFVEYVSYRADDIDEEKLMLLRRQAVLDVKAAHPDLVDVPCIARMDDGSYVDVWIYASQEAAEAANAGAEAIPGFMAFASHHTDVQIRAGLMLASAESPL